MLFIFCILIINNLFLRFEISSPHAPVNIVFCSLTISLMMAVYISRNIKLVMFVFRPSILQSGHHFNVAHSADTRQGVSERYLLGTIMIFNYD